VKLLLSIAPVLFLLNPSSVAGQGFVYPVGNPDQRPTHILPSANSYRITRDFMETNQLHTGVDLENGVEGGQVRSIGPGSVSLRLDTASSKGFGNVVMIRHDLPDGTFYSVYAHLQDGSVAVNIGDHVDARTPIGSVDCTGHTESTSGTTCPSNNGPGPHLHFAVKRTAILGCAYLARCNSGEVAADYVNPLDFIESHLSAAFPLLGTDMPSISGEFAIASYQFIAQQFTLTQAVQVTTINLQMSGFGTDQFTVWVTNSIGPGTTLSNVLLQKNLTFPNTGGGINGQTVSAATNLSLNPGTYFLIVSATQTLVTQGWITSTTVLPSTVGSVSDQAFSTFSSRGSTNTLFPPASIFSTPAEFRTAFQIFGVPLQ